MKSIHSLLAILIQLLMAGSLMSQANITLTFTANMDAQHQTLDSVVILNFTRGGDTVLIYPDTVLLLVDQGIQVFDPDGDHNKGLILHPTFPNPFSGQTTSRFFLPERDVVTIRIIDLLGREVIAYQQTLSAGEHIFNLYPGRERQYLLVVETSRDKRVQKLISMGGGSAFRIEHRASYASFYGFRKGKSGFPWVPGDQLEFIGYATLMGSIMAGDTIPDDPVLSSLYTFQFLGLPVQPSPIQGDTIPCENQTGLQYSVVQQPWVMYTWSVPGGWTIVTGQGTHEITVTAGVTSGVIEVLPTNITGQGPTQTLAVSTQFCPYPPGYVHCNPLGPTLIIDVINPATAKTWMDRNLGASNQMASYNDPGSYGDLFQWGRFADGHQCRTSNTTYLVSTTDQPGHGNFIWGINLQGDWRSPQNDNLWQGVHGVSNPCPLGYRIPTMAEWNQERLSWSSGGWGGSVLSLLKLPMSGCRANQVISSVGFTGYYWSSTVSDTLSKYFSISNSGSSFGNFNRARGASVRCIRDSMGFSVSLPIISTDSVSGITSASAISGGTLISDGGSMITERGVCWRTTPNPTIANSTTNDGVSIGSFTSNLTGLDLLTTYYVRAYATNIAGTAYGNEMVFSTTHFVDPCAGVPIPPGFGIVSSSGKCWLDRNLGAIQVATSSTDESSYGTLYQWGRGTDGHQIRTSSTTPILSSGDTPGHGSFITIMDIPYDWRSPQNVNLWQGDSGVNNPCPAGWRLPTEAEWEAERLSWNSNNTAGAFASPLKLPLVGIRSSYNGALYLDGTHGHYWAGTVFGTSSRSLRVYTNAYMADGIRANGYAVRCIKHDSSPSLPTVSTSPVYSITAITAIPGGNVICNGSSVVTARGVCWSTSPNPTIADSTTNEGISTGLFFSQITGLTTDTPYYVRAYAINSVGIAYGNDVLFVTDSVDPCAGVIAPPGYGIVASSGCRCWLDRNLGATQVATSTIDVDAYGDLYQWGRGIDGHQNRTSSTSTTLSGTDTPGHGNFIVAPNHPRDWRSPQNVNLWQGVNGVNNPCPVGWRVPTDAEWTAERLNWVSSNAAGAFASPLKLTMGGLRNNHGGLNYVDTRGVYWSSTIFGVYSRILEIQNNNSRSWYKDRAVGGSVRCIKD